ncbi:MlaA family lipoprotein [Vibrio sonorensis]|uniref:MlaA family lipoprotein n=1 Tax=Vibrio sonorensis TaxID=1004316 RepID=UPI0008DAA704|nr:MlaA family lipoprotein [Vibrio sonorensis]
MQSHKSWMWLLLLSFSLLGGCASPPSGNDGDNILSDSVDSQVFDPFESFNRSMWTLNYEYLDPYFVRPVSIGYVKFVPSPIRSGISNFLGNLDEPASMINNLLMGNGGKALDHFNRFWINSTFGLLGLIDIASEAGITDHGEKEFGDAVGHYGVGDGPYLMLPGYGPATVRDGADFVDSMYIPLAYLNFWGALGKWAFEGMEARAALVSQEVMVDNSPDPYALTREVYIQRQNFKAEIEVNEYNADEEAELDDLLDDF